MIRLSHLAWVPFGAGVGFAAAFALGNRATLPVDLYYLIYFGIVLTFLFAYATRTRLDLRRRVKTRIAWAVVTGILAGAVLVQGVLARPETAHLSGGTLAWAVLWRGLVYGAVDGTLLLAFPWIVVWRALGAEKGGWGRKIAAGGVAWIAILFVTTAYHLGYQDFRSSRVIQPNIGSTIASVSTLATANPVAAPISHVLLHVAAVIHSPETDLFLPPHRP